MQRAVGGRRRRETEAPQRGRVLVPSRLIRDCRPAKFSRVSVEGPPLVVSPSRSGMFLRFVVIV